MFTELTPESNEADYMAFMTSCLDRQKDGNRPEKVGSIAVVGAGMAGLTAAWVLQLFGYQVKIFEASNRVGGRIRTLRDLFTPGHYVEAGAMRVPKTHKLTNKLIEVFKLDPQDFSDDDQHPWVYVNGEWKTMEEYRNGGLKFAGGQVGSKLFKKYVEPLNDIEDVELRKLLTGVSLGDYLRGCMQGKNRITGEPLDRSLSATDIELILLEESRANMEASLKEVLRDHKAHDGDKIQIAGGMDLLPNSFCKNNYINPDSIIYNARVRQIFSHGPALSIKYENTTTHEEYIEHNFDKVICAAPFSSLCHVNFLPLFHNEPGYNKLRAIQSLHYENSTKIALEVDRQFWRFDGIEGGKSITDLPIRWVHYPNSLQCPGTHGVILASYTWGEDSLRWSALPHDTRLRYAFQNLKQLHSSAFASPEYADTQLIAGMSYSWADDSYSLGAFAVFPPHQEEFFADIWKPHADVHFAGEHTSLRHAWIEGAVESGLRVAREVDVDLNRSYSRCAT